jgi:hypothetical protein
MRGYQKVPRFADGGLVPGYRGRSDYRKDPDNDRSQEPDNDVDDTRPSYFERFMRDAAGRVPQKDRYPKRDKSEPVYGLGLRG